MEYSVLISVYDKEKPPYLKECLQSVFAQTLPPDEVVLVCDGVNSSRLIEVIDSFKEKYPDRFKPIYLKTNVGTATAANIGLKACKNELILKCDSDDICKQNRAQIQLEMFAKDSDLALCGGFIEEFSSQSGEILSVKSVPLEHSEILAYAKRRNPINNPTLALKKSAALKINGYNEHRRCEDYDFVCRMLEAGFKSANSSEILVCYRVSEDNYRRRKNWKNTSSFIAVRWQNFRRGFCSFFDFLLPSCAQLLLFVMPISFTEKFYKKHLRK